MTKPLIPYMRKSSKEDPAISRERQTRVIRAWAQQHGVPLGDERWERAVSGSRHWRERSLGDALAAVERGEAEGIIVEEQSRLSRENGLATAEVWEALQAAGARLVCVNDGLDTANGDQEFSFSIRAAMAREQWKQYARRMEHVKASRIASGVHISGTVAVGLVRPDRGARLELDPERYPAVREAFEIRAAGASLLEVARRLDETLPGGPSGEGVWSTSTVARLLSNRVYLGEASQGKHVRPGAHPALVDVATFDTVQALRRRRERPALHADAKSLLAGLVRCETCGYAMVHGQVNHRYHRYKCRGRSGTAVCDAPAGAAAPALEELVSEAVLDRLSGTWEFGVLVGPDALDGIGLQRRSSPEEVADLHARLATARDDRTAYENPAFVRQLGIEAATRTLAKLDEEIAAAEEQLADAVPVAPPSFADFPQLDTGDARDVWPTLSTADRRDVISALVETVVISPTRGVRGTDLTDRVRVVWKGEEIPVRVPTRGRHRQAA